jgi:hypothetical protein
MDSLQPIQNTTSQLPRIIIQGVTEQLDRELRMGSSRRAQKTYNCGSKLASKLLDQTGRTQGAGRGMVKAVASYFNDSGQR